MHNFGGIPSITPFSHTTARQMIAKNEKNPESILIKKRSFWLGKKPFLYSQLNIAGIWPFYETFHYASSQPYLRMQSLTEINRLSFTTFTVKNVLEKKTS